MRQLKIVVLFFTANSISFAVTSNQIGHKMQIKISTLRKVKMDTMKKDRVHKIKRQQKRKNCVKRLLKIYHLNDDCLERIFFQLDLLELAKVADSNIRLAAVAADVFAQKYHQQEIQIKCHQTLQRAYNYGRMPFEDMRMILEHFGKHISLLDIDFGPFICTSVVQRVVNKLSEFCSNTLLQLKLGLLTDGVKFPQPFVKLEKLVFYKIFRPFPDPIKLTAKTFPNVRGVEFRNVRFAFNNIQMDPHLSTLHHFGYYTFPYVQFSAEDLHSIQRIIQLNPQIKSLGMYLGTDDMSSKAMRSLSMSMEPMSGIETFEAVSSYPMENGPFHFANIKHLKLIGSSALDRGWLDIANQIEQLDLFATPIDERIVDFIVKCQNLKRLEIVIAEDFEMGHIQYIAKSLPSLSEVHFSVYQHNKERKHSTAISAVIEFMQHCKHLTKATVAHDIDSGQHFDRSLYKHNAYTESKPIINLYRDTIDRCVHQSSQWRINHQLKPTELIKGFEGFHSYIFFRTNFQKRCPSNA